jgi:tetratricopeptide (TPR) repeat protein
MSEADQPGPSFVQNVVAVNGFAYGAIDADIHVFANGLPLYLLANWHSEAGSDPEWLRELPSRMLNARRAIVPFTGREGELAVLRQWRDSGPRLAVRWLHGPGGQGKTRLAAQCASEAVADGWKVIAAFHGPDADQIEAGSQDLSLAGAAGVLLMVDYADRWLLTNLTWLLKNKVLHQTGVRTRVLMVARTAGTWPSIRGVLDVHQADTSSQPLAALSQETKGQRDERLDMFTAARDSFAAIYQHPDATAIEMPRRFDDPDFGLTLALHMAALVAVDTSIRGRRPPGDMAGLTMYLLDREQLHWGRLYSDGMKATEGGKAYRTPREVMKRCVYTACLTGAVAPAQGTEILRQLSLPGDPHQLLADHATCYPPTGATVLEPLYPDRLAEDFLALTLPGHSADYPTHPWAGPATALLLARAAPDTTPLHTRRAITFLATAAARWAHVGETHLFALLNNDPQLAIAAGSAALSALAAIDSIDPELLEAILEQLPHEGQVDLDVGAADIEERLTPHRLSRVDDPGKRAQVHRRLATARERAGRRQQSVAAAQSALDIYRTLADNDPRTHLPDVAAMLHTIAADHAYRREHQQALPLITEAIDAARQCVTDSMDPMPGAAPVAESVNILGQALQIYGAVLAGLGRYPEAERALRESVDRFWRRPRDPDREVLSPALFGSLAALTVVLLAQNREETPPAMLQAGQIMFSPGGLSAQYQHFHRWPPDDLGRFLWNVRHAPAGTDIDPAAAIRRAADVNPDAHRAGLADAAYQTAYDAFQDGKYEEALRGCIEAVESYRRSGQNDPTSHLPGLSRALTLHTMLLTAAGRFAEAIEASADAVDLHRQIRETTSPAPDVDYVRGLGAYATARLSAWSASRRGERRAGDRTDRLPVATLDEALVAATQAVTLALGGQDAKSLSDDAQKRLWSTGSLMAATLHALGRSHEARATCRRLGVPYRLRRELFYARLATWGSTWRQSNRGPPNRENSSTISSAAS